LEFRLWTLIGVKLASKWELETVYTLDDALKLYALWRMSQDIQAFEADKLKKEVASKAKRR